MTGNLSYHQGIAAEQIVAGKYAAAGYHIAAQRERTQAGEIDLILEKEGQVIFVEVKQRKNLASAAQSLSVRQQQRILASADVYLAQNHDLDTDCRVDVALVDGIGAVHILENALMA